MSAGMVMLACQLPALNKVGIIMVVTIASSFAHALFFLVPLLFLFGPDEADRA